MAGELDALIFGYRYLLADETEVAQRKKISFGPEFTVEDDDTLEATRVTVTPTALGGGTTGIQANAADVLYLTPATEATCRRLEACGAVTTPDAVAVDLDPELGDPAVTLDASDFTVIVTAFVTARKGSADYAGWVVRRLFARDGSGAVSAGAATSAPFADKQGTASGTPWLAPVLAWNATTKFPKLTLDSNEAAVVNWSARFVVEYMLG